jgi:hypothetical protein
VVVVVVVPHPLQAMLLGRLQGPRPVVQPVRQLPERQLRPRLLRPRRRRQRFRIRRTRPL